MQAPLRSKLRWLLITAIIGLLPLAGCMDCGLPGIAIDVTYVDRERSSGRWILETITSEERDLYSLAVVSATDGWTVGIGGRVYHYDGASWTLHTTTVEGSTLDSIAMVSATDGWIVGWGGRIYRTIP